MNIIINGYGVPKNILKDQNYHAYLGQILNFLWDNYQHKNLNIILCGGNTDMCRPYKRTEAGQMHKWFYPRIKNLHLDKNWQLIRNSVGLSAVENLLTSKNFLASGGIIYFCEITRQYKSRTLVKKIFGSRAKVIAIEFDTSPARYDAVTRKKLEQKDLQYSLKALDDKDFSQRLKKANQEKIKQLRKLSSKQRRLQIDKITLDIGRQYLS